MAIAAADHLDVERDVAGELVGHRPQQATAELLAPWDNSAAAAARFRRAYGRPPRAGRESTRGSAPSPDRRARPSRSAPFLPAATTRPDTLRDRQSNIIGTTPGKRPATVPATERPHSAAMNSNWCWPRSARRCPAAPPLPDSTSRIEQQFDALEALPLPTAAEMLDLLRQRGDQGVFFEMPPLAAAGVCWPGERNPPAPSRWRRCRAERAAAVSKRRLGRRAGQANRAFPQPWAMGGSFN